MDKAQKFHIASNSTKQELFDLYIEEIKRTEELEGMLKSSKAVTPEMLTAAMKMAVDTGLLPKDASLDKYTENWKCMEAILEAARWVSSK